MEILGLLVVLVAAYWAKNNLLKPDTSKAIDDSCRRAVNSVKKMLSNKTENVSELPEQQDVVAPVVEKQSPVVDEHLSQSNKVTQNIAAPAEAVSQTVVAKKSSAIVLNPVPEDSVLKRHYQTQLVAERSSITHPYPTDSVLRRHYEAKLQAAVSTAPKADAVELVVEAIDQVSPVTTTNQQNFPEDSVLKRHFTQLIEASEAA